MAESVAFKREKTGGMATGFIVVAVVVDPVKCGIPMANTPEFLAAVQADPSKVMRALEGRAAVVVSMAEQAELNTDAELDAQLTASIAEVQAQIALRKSLRGSIDLQ